MENNQHTENLKTKFPGTMGTTVNTPQAGSASKRFYAIAPETDGVIRRFRLRLRSGTSYSIPYALLPLMELEGNKVLRLYSHDIHITIKGRNLKELEKWLGEERLLWISESESGTDTEESDVFVSEIAVECIFTN